MLKHLFIKIHFRKKIKQNKQVKSVQSLLRKRTLHKIKMSTNNCLLRLLYFKQNKKIHYLSTPLPNTKITFDSHTQRNSASEKLPPMFEDHYSNNDLVTNVEKSLTKKKNPFVVFYINSFFYDLYCQS